MIKHLLTRLLPLVLITDVYAEELLVEKTWEVGLGVGVLSIPDYRGSSEERDYVAPIPYAVYRGKFMQSDRDGVRGQFLRTDKYELTLSGSGSISPDNHKNTLRAGLGLPKLGSNLELGPALNINLTGESLRQGWLLSLPLRGVFALDGDDTGYIGYTVEPELTYRQRWNDFVFSFSTSLSYADQDYHAYYYSLEEEYATQDFLAYEAKGGFSGWANKIALSRQFGNWIGAVFVRHDDLGDTVFVDSPLVETNGSTRGGFAIIWVWK